MLKTSSAAAATGAATRGANEQISNNPTTASNAMRATSPGMASEEPTDHANASSVASGRMTFANAASMNTAPTSGGSATVT